MSNYNFVRLNNDNFEDLINLFIASGKRVNRKLLEKKYQTDYTGIQKIGYIAYDENNNPSAFYGVIPAIAKLNGEEILIAQSADTLTHPMHQRKGLFTKLASKTYELAEEEGIKILYGVPNMLSFPGFMKKLDWIHLENLKKFKIKILSIPISKISKKISFLNNCHRVYSDLIIKLFFKTTEFDSNNNYEAASTQNSAYLEINKEYFNYKKYKPKYLLKINEVLIWISVDGALKIGDILTKDNSIVNEKKIIRRLKLLAFLIGTNEIVFLCNKEYDKLDFFKSHFTESEGLPLIIKPLKNEVNIERFHIRMADIDTF